MSQDQVYLARHGETAWTVTGQHTGRTDIPLTPRGERNARRLGVRLQGMTFAHVFSSPLQRAKRTCELAGFQDRAILDEDLVEWDYGAYEGKTTAQIVQSNPGWDIFRDGCPAGESPQQIGARADRVLARWRALTGAILVFSSAHCLRVLGARWCGLEAAAGRYLYLNTATLSILGYEHEQAVIRLWNDGHHVSED